jgi:hypothetical protein
MRLLHLPSFVPAVLFLGLVVTTFQSTQLSAQSFCGPVTLVNFNGINGQYPAAGVMFDSGYYSRPRLSSRTRYSSALP